jgi:hypothetical protein
MAALPFIRIVPTAFFGALCVASAVQADKTLGTFQDITVATKDHFTCEPSVPLRISAADAAVFSDAARMGKLLGAVRAMLEFECKGVKIEDIMFEGFANGTSRYKAVASEKSEWTLLTMTVPEPQTEGSTIARAPSPDTEGTSFLPDLKPPPPATQPAEGVPTRSDTSSTSQSPDNNLSNPQWDKLRETAEKGTFSTRDYNFPVLMSRIYYGELPSIPDDQRTRSVVISIMKAFNTNCGERASDVALAALRYGSPQMRRIDRNPQSVFDEALLPFYKLMKGIESGGPMKGLEEFSKASGPLLLQEGVEDGEQFVRTNGCGNAAYKQFARNLDTVILTRTSKEPAPEDDIAFSSLMSPSLRKHYDLPDPETALRERNLKQYTATAVSSCGKAYAKAAFCDCLVKELQSLNLDDSEWKRVGANFPEGITTMAATHESLKSSVLSCNRR